MVTKTKLGLVCAALMMILGTQGVDAQKSKQSQKVPAKVSIKASSDRKELLKSVPVAESNKALMDQAPMNRAPRRESGTTTSDVTHVKSWYQAKTYTWTDANNVSHTSPFTDEVTDPYQIYGFIYSLYSDPSIPGIHYSGMRDEPIPYRFPWGQCKEYVWADQEAGTYYPSRYSYLSKDLGWGLQGSGENGRPIPVTTPTENGYTVCLVKEKDSFSNSIDAFLSKESLIDYIGECVESVQLLTDGLRVDEGGDQAGTVFTYTGNLNRFFFIAKGKDYEVYKFDQYVNSSTYSQLSSTPTFSGSPMTLSSPWEGTVSRYGSRTGGYYYYLTQGSYVYFTVPETVKDDTKLKFVINTANSTDGDGYFYVGTKNEDIIQPVSRNTSNEITLEGTFNAGDMIIITGCTVDGYTTASPDITGFRVQYTPKQVAYDYYPSIKYDNVNDPDNYECWGAAPFYDMFEEFSPTTTAANAQITDFYSKMMQGDTYPIEHDCTGVINLGHYFSMSGKLGTESHSLSNLVFYIPDNRANGNSREYDPSTPPMVGLYVIQLEASIAPDDEHKDHTFDVTVDWESSLNDITNSDVPQTYELHAYWTDPVTGVEKDSIIYTGPNTTYTYEVPQFMASYTIDYKVKGRPTNATNPDEFTVWSNVDDVIVPGYDDFFMLDRDHYESDFVITSETNFYRNFLYPKNKDVGGFTPQAIEGGMKHFILYRQSTDEGGEPVPAADLYFESANGKVYYKIEYRDEYQHPITNN